MEYRGFDMSAKFVRYTCAKKNHPVLRKDCEICPEYKPCAQDGKWCFVGALLCEEEFIWRGTIQPFEPSPIDKTSKDTASITISFGNGKYGSAEVPREDLREALEKQIAGAMKPRYSSGKYRW